MICRMQVAVTFLNFLEKQGHLIHLRCVTGFENKPQSGHFIKKNYFKIFSADFRSKVQFRIDKNDGCFHILPRR